MKIKKTCIYESDYHDGNCSGRLYQCRYSRTYSDTLEPVVGKLLENPLELIARYGLETAARHLHRIHEYGKSGKKREYTAE